MQEPNIRYLALENLTRLALVPEVLDSIRPHQVRQHSNRRPAEQQYTLPQTWTGSCTWQHTAQQHLHACVTAFGHVCSCSFMPISSSSRQRQQGLFHLQ